MSSSRLLAGPAPALFALALAAYAYFYQAGGWNQNVRVDLTRALVEQRSPRIDRYHANTGDKGCRGPGGRCVRARPDMDQHYYCDKAPGVSLLGVIPYAPMWALAGSERPALSFLVAASYLSTVVAVALPSAAAVALLYLLLAGFGVAARIRAVVALGWAFATLAWPYATLLYGHQLAAALLIAAFALLVRAHRLGTPARPELVGVLLGWSVVSEYPAALAVVPIFVYAAVTLRPGWRLARVVAGGAACAIVLGGYHWIAFGGPFTLPYEFSTQEYRGMGYFMGLGVPNWPAFSNTMFTPYRGLFYSAPWLLGALPGGVLLWRRGFRAEVGVCAAVCVGFVWMVSSILESWHGGWSLGSRYMIPAIPFLVVLVAGLGLLDLGARVSASRVRLVRGLAWAGAVASLGLSTWLMLAGTAVRPEVPQHIRKPFEQYLLPHLYAGTLATNPQHIDRIDSPAGGPRQAWNLGMLMGLDGLASLLPLALLAALGLAWLARGVRREERNQAEAGAEGARAPPA
ncbi:hypothetical protein [Haliangium sp.]|uniref:hypothetical protein n=1 Tax=Haliangium sp. TaxID=2663208 RepID=UPI003D0967B0